MDSRILAGYRIPYVPYEGDVMSYVDECFHKSYTAVLVVRHE